MGAFYTNLILDAFLILFPILYVKYAGRREPTLGEFGLARGKGTALQDAALAGKILGALLIASVALSLLLQIFKVHDFGAVESVIRSLLSLPFPALLYFMVVRVFAEEFFFRAFLVPRFGVVMSSALFGLSHLAYGSVAEVIGAAFLGGVLAHYYSKSSRLLPNYIAHMLYNFIAFAVAVGA